MNIGLDKSFGQELRRAAVWPLIIVLALLLVLIGLVSYLLQTAGRVDHTNRVLAQISRVEKLAVDLETGIRGYCVTADPRFLEPYQRASTNFPTQLNGIETLVRDNPCQLQAVRDLRQLNAAWYGFAVTARQRAANRMPQELAVQLRGKALMDAIRKRLDGMQTYEEQLLAERSRTLGRVRVAALTGIVISVIVLAPLLTLSLRRGLAGASSSYRDALATAEAERERLKVTLSSIGDAVIATNEKGEITYMNAVAAALTGWPATEANGHPLATVFQIVNERTRLPVENPVERVLREGRVVGLANHTLLLARDGREIPIADTAAPIHGETGGIFGVVLVFHDQTEERQAAARAAWLASFPEDNPNPIVELDLNAGLISYANSFTAQLFPEILIQGLDHPFFAGLREAAQPLLEQKNGFVRREITVGESCYAQTIRYIPSENRIRVYCSDITKGKEQERRLAEQARLLDLSYDPIIVRDEQDRITYWNHGATETYGYACAEALGRSIHELLGTEFPEDQSRIREALLRDGRWSGELVHMHKDGTKIIMASRWVLDRDSDGEPAFVLETNNDVTLRRRAEDALARSKAELETAVEERTAQLRAALAELESYSYSIAHDMRAPLRGMQGFSKLLMEEYAKKLDARAQQYLQRIMNSAERLDRLIQDVLSYSKIMRGDLALEPVSTRTLLDDIIQSYPNLQPPKVEITLEEPLPPVMANLAALTQAFSNLLGNAAKFVAPGVTPKIRIWSELKQKTVRIWIADNGIGIESGAQERIFQLFQRLHGPDIYEGTGVGLAIVKKAVEKMGGKVGVESGEEQGSKFWLELTAA